MCLQILVTDLSLSLFIVAFDVFASGFFRIRACLTASVEKTFLVFNFRDSSSTRDTCFLAVRNNIGWSGMLLRRRRLLLLPIK